jgi:AraC family transcriptional activator of pyochelin receptor
MYYLEGTEFADILKRDFTRSFQTTRAAGGVADKFNCQTESLMGDAFNILHFSGSFNDELHIGNMHDATHVSIHFQLMGSSDAYISGIDNSLSLSTGSFNLLNCVDPLSSFIFHKQQHYEYVCIGLKPSFFMEILSDCGSSYQHILEQSQNYKPYALFPGSKQTSRLQHSALKLITGPPVADSLRNAYIRSKITELTLLTLDQQSGESPTHETISTADTEKLMAVKKHLDSNYLDELSLKGIARDFLLNEFKLKRGFKKLFGTTVFGYVHDRQMLHALNLTRSGGYTVGEVATITGYQSDASFIRAFKQYFGYSPGSVK